MKCSPAIDDVARPEAGTLRVLVVDDNAVNRKLLQELLRREGYEVTTAADGAEAIARFEQESVDFVFMDVMMPGMNGYEATRRIKEISRAQERFCPVLFVTALTDESALTECLGCGGDDFMVKPFNHAILRAKMCALERTRDLYALINRQKNELAVHNENLRHQHEIAERTFSKLMRTGYLDAPNLNYLLEPVDLTSGDLLLAATTPNGTQHVLLGDFTGHGLAAAMGAIPVSDMFQGMTRKGFGIGQIAAEMNRKLKASLPVGQFLAACLISLDAQAGHACVWNGGVPEVLLRRPGEGICARIASRHLPLGILDDEDFDARLECLDVRAGDCIYAYSDGVIEAVDPEGRMFGSERLEAVLNSPASSGCFSEIRRVLGHFREQCAQHDDIALIEIECRPMAAMIGEAAVGERTDALRLQAEFSADRLRQGNLHSDLTRLLDLFPGLGRHRSALYTVIAELAGNALDHGLLQLTSAMKDDADGFGEYYRERERRLRRLKKGNVRIELQFAGDTRNGSMRILVADSGPGFSAAQAPQSVPEQGLARRGLALVRSLCGSLEIHPPGNRVEAVYAWSARADAS